MSMVPQVMAELERLQNRDYFDRLTGDQLVHLEVWFSTVLPNIGREYADALKAHLDAEVMRRYALSNAWVAIKKEMLVRESETGERYTPTEITNRAELRIAVNRKEENAKKQTVESLEILIDAIPLVINSLKDKIKRLEAERVTSR